MKKPSLQCCQTINEISIRLHKKVSPHYLHSHIDQDGNDNMKLIETSARSLYQVLELFLIIPNGTAEVERFFKFIKAMKSKTRNRLGSEKARKMITIAWYLYLKKLDLDVLYKLLLQCM